MKLWRRRDKERSWVRLPSIPALAGLRAEKVPRLKGVKTERHGGILYCLGVTRYRLNKSSSAQNQLVNWRLADERDLGILCGCRS